MKTINARFPDRATVEIAVEHLVQEYGIDRSDIFIRALSETDKSSGNTEAAIELSVDVHEDEIESTFAAFREAGASNVREH